MNIKLIPVAIAVLALGACSHFPQAHTVPGSGQINADKVTICHKEKKTMELPRTAAEGHMGHGDRYGRC